MSSATALLAVVLVAVAALAPCALAHDPNTPENDKFGRVRPAANFSADDYAGLWYEFARTPTVFEIGLKCVTAQYTVQDDGSIGVVNRGVRMYPFPKRISKVTGVAVVPNPDEPAKLTVKFKNIPSNGKTNYWVLNTDYNNWSVVYSPSRSRMSKPGVFILTRQPFPSRGTVRAALNELAVQTGILVNDLIITKQQTQPC